MNKEQLKQLLSAVQSGSMDIETALNQIKNLPYDDLGFAKIDTHRTLRRGFPEVIFCQGKTVDQVRDIIKRMKTYDHVILGMRASNEQYQAVRKITKTAIYNSQAQAIIVGQIPDPVCEGLILVVSAGTADIPVAEEAAITGVLEGLETQRSQRVEAAAELDEAIIFGDGLERFAFAPGAMPWRYNLLVDDADLRERIVQELVAAGVRVGAWYPPIAPLFGDRGSYPQARDLARRILNIEFPGGAESGAASLADLVNRAGGR